MKCQKLCKRRKEACPISDCRFWQNYEKEYNCMFESIDKNGNMSQSEIAKRQGVSQQTIHLVEKNTLQKIKDGQDNEQK